MPAREEKKKPKTVMLIEKCLGEREQEEKKEKKGRVISYPERDAKGDL